MPTGFETALVREISDALRSTFDDSYPVTQFRGITAGPEFMEKRELFPMIYFTTAITMLKNAGLGHRREIIDEDSGEDRRILNWVFQGRVQFNTMALTSQGCAELGDNVLNVLAFGRENQYMKKFHDDILDNDWINLYLMTEEIECAPQTSFQPEWGTEDELIYHRAYTVNMTGEFFSDPYTAAVIRISHIPFYPYRGADQPVPQGSQLPQDINEPWVG